MNDRRDFLDAVLSKLATRAEASASVDRAKTGRVLDYHSPHEIQCDILAAEWMSLDSVELMISHRARERFESELARIPAISISQEVLRGRHFDPSDPKRSISSEFGPPPQELCSAGRYNMPGQPVLYLASSDDGVRSEVQVPPGRVLMSQGFFVPTDLRIADLTNNSIDPFIANAFDRAEHMESAEYFRSNVLAQLVSRQFQAMLVPGVRGSRQNRYSNLVVFSPEELWRRWLNPSSAPRKLE
jgi:hypothetical protein